MLVVDAGDQLGRQDLRPGGIPGGGSELREHRGARRLHGGGRAGVDLEVAELALDDQDARLHVGGLERTSVSGSMSRPGAISMI